MSADFLDTNVILYLLDDGPKADRAAEVVASGGTISVQVLNETLANCIRNPHSNPPSSMGQPWRAIPGRSAALTSSVERGSAMVKCCMAPSFSAKDNSRSGLACRLTRGAGQCLNV